MTTKSTEPFKTINLDKGVVCPRLWSRYAWQVLFDLYRESGATLEHMGDMLCDLYGLQEFFERRCLSQDKGECLWSFNLSGGTTLDLNPSPWAYGDVRIVCDFQEMKIWFHREDS